MRRLAAGEDLDFVKQIKPILTARCYACHGPLRKKSGLRVDTAAALIEGGDSGAAVPHVRNAAWVRNPVDAFIAAEQESQGLVPVVLADKSTLLRRVYLDLVGLPPTREELTAFLANDSPTAYEEVVDRLLASPQYGERWARHWMDVWRYSDWAGYKQEIRESAQHIWHWRDWIAESLNADKGYDRMATEML